MGNGSILELKNLTKKFGSVIAVNNVSLNITDGEFLTLLGPSGSGKSTVLNMIAGFEYPTTGEIILQGQPINNLLPEKRNIGMVFQNYALFPHMTIFDNVAFPLKMRKYGRENIKEKVLRAMHLVQLSGFEERFPKQLSGGQQQRVALARALVFDPPLMLLDEPLGALDKKLRSHMHVELKHLHTQLNRTMIYVTHDQEEALVMSDRIAVMDNGVIVQVGEPDELYDQPADEFVAGFIGESNIFKGVVVSQTDDGVLLRLEDDGSEHFFKEVSGFSSGQAACFCLRPEKIYFVDEGAPEGCLKGVIEEVIYVGETKRYQIRISPGRTIQLREMSVRIGKGRRPGQNVDISWHGPSLRVV